MVQFFNRCFGQVKENILGIIIGIVDLLIELIEGVELICELIAFCFRCTIVLTFAQPHLNCYRRPIQSLHVVSTKFHFIRISDALHL